MGMLIELARQNQSRSTGTSYFRSSACIAFVIEHPDFCRSEVINNIIHVCHNHIESTIKIENGRV